MGIKRRVKTKRAVRQRPLQSPIFTEAIVRTRRILDNVDIRRKIISAAHSTVSRFEPRRAGAFPSLRRRQARTLEFFLHRHARPMRISQYEQ